MSFIWPPEGDFGVIAKLASQEAVNTFDTLIFDWESPFDAVRLILVCLEHGTNIFESNSTQLFNSGPYEIGDVWGISSLDFLGLSDYATYPTSCEIVLKDWEATDDPPDLGFNGTTQYGTIGHLFLVTSNDATSTTYEPTRSTATGIEATTTETSEASTSTTSESSAEPSSTTFSSTSSTAFSTLAVVNTNTTSSANQPTTPPPPSTSFTTPETTMFSASLPITDPLTLSSQPTPSPSPTTPPPLNIPLKIGLGVGISLGSLIFIALIILIFLRRKKSRRRPQCKVEEKDMMIMTPSRATAGLKSELPAYAEKAEEKRLFEVCDEGEGRRDRWELESPKGGAVDGLLLGGCGGGGGGRMHELDGGRGEARWYRSR
ncbi:hypothetical protein LTS08_002839 [Lithohypha guttulata]|nr:hypothetical protein LTS08_002839 [Lithohypha guttulata]